MKSRKPKGDLAHVLRSARELASLAHVLSLSLDNVSADHAHVAWSVEDGLTGLCERLEAMGGAS